MHKLQTQTTYYAVQKIMMTKYRLEKINGKQNELTGLINSKKRTYSEIQYIRKTQHMKHTSYIMVRANPWSTKAI
jgi:hypothetical protein